MACGVQLAAVVTSNGESAERFARKWNVPLYGDDPSIAFSDKIDVVHVCTPPPFHAEYVREAVRAGKHVLCEKPLSLDAEEAASLAALAGKSNVRCGVCYNVRYHTAVQKAREIIQSGVFGRPLLIHGNYLQEFHALPAPYDWRYDPVLSGGVRAVTEIGSHWIDTAQYVSGKKVCSVSAALAGFYPDRILKDGMMEPADCSVDKGTTAGNGSADKAVMDKGVAANETTANGAGAKDAQVLHVDSEDAACIMLRFEDGAVGSVFLSEISPGRGNHLSLEITCENGNLWWNEEENNVLYTAQKGEGIRKEVFAFGNGFQDTFVSLIRSFYAGSGYPDFEDGALTAKVCEAVVRSAADDSAWTMVR